MAGLSLLLEPEASTLPLISWIAEPDVRKRLSLGHREKSKTGFLFLGKSRILAGDCTTLPLNRNTLESKNCH